MLRLAFDFIITWRETRTRPNAYNEIIGKIICVNEKAGIPDVYVGMSFYHS